MALGRMLRSLPLMLATVALAAAAPRAAAPMLAQVPQAPARVALLHAAPLADNSTVTVTVDSGSGDSRVGALSFSQALEYFDTPPGARVVKLFAGDLPQAQLAGAAPLLVATATLEAGKDYTLAAVGGANDYPLELLTLDDSGSPPTGTLTKLRLAHLAPFAKAPGVTAVDLVTESGQAVPPLLNLAYKAVSAYQPLPSDVTFDLKLVPSGQPGAPPLLDLPPRSFERGQLLTMFVIGGANGRAPMIVELAQAPRKPARLSVVHAVPGAGGNPLNLLLNGSRRLENLSFASASGPLALDEGPYTLTVEQPGSPPGLLTSVDAVLRRDQEYVALIRPGPDGQGVSITVEPLVPPGDAPQPGYGWLVIYHVAPFDTGERGRVDVRDNQGRLLLESMGALRFGERRVVALPAREYDLRFTSVGGDRLLATVAPFTLSEGGVATIYAVGSMEGGPSGSIVVADPVQVKLFLPSVVD